MANFRRWTDYQREPGPWPFKQTTPQDTLKSFTSTVLKKMPKFFQREPSGTRNGDGAKFVARGV